MIWNKIYSSVNSLTLFFCSLTFCLPACAAHSNHADHLISGIMSYTSWESDLTHINFCVIDGPAKFISPNIFNPPSAIIQPNKVKILHLKLDEVTSNAHTLNEDRCNVLYFVNTSDYLQQKLLKDTVTKVLTISENNPECSIGSAFCLNRSQQKFSFQVNLNSLRQSKIRVNSKVLILSEGSN